MIHKVTRALALAAATGAVAAPAASAMLPPPDPPVSHAPQPVVLVKTVHQSDGFSYLDAAIGAGAATLLVLAGSGGRLALHRARRSQVSAASRA